MLVRKIKDIRSTDAFDSFNWSGDDLRRYNLIYGWNGSGKTTISRILNFVERKAIHIPDLQSIEFNIQTETGSIKHDTFRNDSITVKVFNEDFIKENLSFDDSKAKKIVVLGKENVAAQREINDLQDQYEIKRKQLDQLLVQQSKSPKLEQILTEAGGEVTKQFGNTPLANDKYYGRSYNKSKVQARIDSGTVNEGNLKSLIIDKQETIDSKREVVKGGKGKIEFDATTISDFEDLFSDASDLLNSNVEVEEIEGLKNDKKLRDWTETGYYLHKERKEGVCQFCGHNLPDGLLDRLGKSFTDELKKVKAGIEGSISKLEGENNNLTNVDVETSALFPELSKEFSDAKKIIVESNKIVDEKITTLIGYLKNKQENLHDHSKKYPVVEYPKEAVKNLNDGFGKINGLVTQHNKRVDSLQEEIKTAAESIELHVIASALINKQYFQKKKEKAGLDNQVSDAKSEVDRLSAEIKNKKASLQNATEAVERMNSILKEFFGESQVYLEVKSSEEKEVAYVLKRKGRDAKHLSEGEKSVLALVYFLIKLEEDGFTKSDSVIVLDDPVDSQDSMFLFHTFGLLKRQLKGVGQLIIMTHNYEFFNLIRDWLVSKIERENSWLFFIGSHSDNGTTEVKVENLPDLLLNFKSEYQYLFSRLYKHANNVEKLDEPLVANVSRKVLEYFAGFKWSCKTTEEFTSIVLNRFVADQNQLKKGTGDFVVKFLHEYSHGQDFSRPISASVLEANAVAKNVLTFIKLADKEHYDYLESLCV